MTQTIAQRKLVASLNKAKPQKLFDQVLTAMREQRVRSTSSGTEMCLYRGPRGNKCALGHLIPDKAYDKEMECNTLNGLMTKSHFLDGLSDDRQDLLGDLQDKHDEWMPTRKGLSMKPFEAEMAVLAQERSLTYTPPIKKTRVAA